MHALLPLLTPPEVQRILATRLREARITSGLKQETLSRNAGVALATLRRFERTGEVSLKHLLRLCHALGRMDDFDSLLHPPPAKSMAELEARTEQPSRKRGTR